MQFFCQEEKKISPMTLLPFFEEEKVAKPAWNKEKFQNNFSKVIESANFRAKKGDTFWFFDGENSYLFVGLGKEEEINLESIRFSFGEAVQVIIKKKKKEISSPLIESSKFSSKAIFRAQAEGIFFSNYSFDKYKKEKLEKLEKATLFFAASSFKEEVKDLEELSDAVFLARDLVNDNADFITSQKLSEISKNLEGRSSKIKVKILEKKEIESLKMGLLLAVNQGSKIGPNLIEISFLNNPKSEDHTVLVGKGITFDTGGLCLKPATNMDTMKHDMGGAASVIATMKMVAFLDLPLNVTGIIPTTDNAIGNTSYKPGDVFTSMSGKTVEVVNTDAEGRLILADAFTYAIQKLSKKPTRIIDIATLTGAISVALGDEIMGLFSNDDGLSEELLKASFETGEDAWRMPLPPSYLSILKSDIADLKNCGERTAGSITAALFLKEFVNSKIAWAHLDIAGIVDTKKSKGYYSIGATGVPVRLLVKFLEGLSNKK